MMVALLAYPIRRERLRPRAMLLGWMECCEDSRIGREIESQRRRRPLTRECEKVSS